MEASLQVGSAATRREDHNSKNDGGTTVATINVTLMLFFGINLANNVSKRRVVYKLSERLESMYLPT